MAIDSFNKPFPDNADHFAEICLQIVPVFFESTNQILTDSHPFVYEPCSKNNKHF